MRTLFAAFFAVTVFPLVTLINTPNLFTFYVTRQEPQNLAWKLFVGAVDLINQLVN